MGSKTPATTTQTNTVQLSPEQQALFAQAMPFINQYANSPLPTLPTSTIVGFNPNELAAQTGAINAATGAGAQLGGQSASSLGMLLNPNILSPDSNPYLKATGDAVTQNLTDNLFNKVLPGVRAGSSMAGGIYSGGNTGEAIATGLGIGETQKAAGSAVAGLYNDAYKTGLQTMLGANQQVPLTQQALLFGPTVQGQVGGQERAMTQAQLDATNQTALLQSALPFLRAQDILSLMQGMPGGAGVSTVTGAQPQQSAWQSGLGGAITGGTLGSTFGPWGTLLGAGGGALAGILGR
jgi:hypothetical protein